MRVNRISTKLLKDNNAEIDITLLDDLFERFRPKRGSIIPLLQGTQECYGYLPRPALKKISEVTGIPLSNIYGVATFYSQFRLAPVGKHIIKVCHGTACHVQSAPKITEALMNALNIKDGGTTEDGFITLESVACLGCCSLAPVMMIGNETYGNLTGREAVKIVKELRLLEGDSNEKMDVKWGKCGLL